jgi:hypothetical protein
MATQGWVALTSVEKNEVVVTQLTAEEFRATARDTSGYLQAEKRINAELGGDDLRCPWFVRGVHSGPSARGLPFQEFRNVYRPPILYYRDIFQSGAWNDGLDDASPIVIVILKSLKRTQTTRTNLCLARKAASR